MIKVENIKVARNQKVVLKDFSANFAINETTLITGANGAGKTTLLKAISGELPLQAGSITINGKSINNLSSKELFKLRSVAPQQREFTFNYKVKELLDLTLTYRNANNASISASNSARNGASNSARNGAENDLSNNHQPAENYSKLNQFKENQFKENQLAERHALILEKLGLDLKADIWELSIGQQQRVSIAMALWPTAPFYLLDEPISAQDSHYEREIADLVGELASAHGFLIVTHGVSALTDRFSNICSVH